MHREASITQISSCVTVVSLTLASFLKFVVENQRAHNLPLPASIDDLWVKSLMQGTSMAGVLRRGWQRECSSMNVYTDITRMIKQQRGCFCQLKGNSTKDSWLPLEYLGNYDELLRYKYAHWCRNNNHNRSFTIFWQITSFYLQGISWTTKIPKHRKT